MSALVCYMIEAIVSGDENAMPCVVQLPVRRVSMPSRREAGRLIRVQYPDARDATVRRSAQAHLAWAASGAVRRKLAESPVVLNCSILP